MEQIKQIGQWDREYSDSQWLNLSDGENKVRLISGHEVFGMHYIQQDKVTSICIGYDDGCEYCIKSKEYQLKLQELGDPKNLDEKQKSQYDGILEQYMIYKVKVQFIRWVIDRKDNSIKILKHGAMVQKQISELAKSSEYKFDNIPNYDVIIKKEGKGLTTKYTTLPSRESSLSIEEIKKINETITSLSDIIDKMKDKIMPIIEIEPLESVEPSNKTLSDKDEEIKIDDIPF